MKHTHIRRMTIGVLAVMTVLVFSACKGAPKPGLSLTKNEFIPGEMITVKYTALPEYDTSAWVGIIPSSVAHGSEAENDRHDLIYQYLRKSTGGELNFRAPMESGKYDFRMHNTDSDGVEVASVTFSVALPPQLQQQASKPEAEAKKFGEGDAVMVEWKGSWWPAKVIALRDGATPYKIHYDGYSKSWDEWVGDARIRKR